MKRVLYILLSVMLLAVSFAEAGAQTDKREVLGVGGTRSGLGLELTAARLQSPHTAPPAA